MSRLDWVRSAPFTSRTAQIRAFWYYVIRRHRYEICLDCGRPVGPHTGSWWEASDELWSQVVGHENGVLCPPCFTHRANTAGVPVHWKVVPGV